MRRSGDVRREGAEWACPSRKLEDVAASARVQREHRLELRRPELPESQVPRVPLLREPVRVPERPVQAVPRGADHYCPRTR